MKLHPFFCRPKRYRLRWSCSAANGARNQQQKQKIRKEKPLSILDPVMPAMYCAITKKERVNDQATSTEGGAAPAARKGDGDPKEMTGNEYQRLAARMINESLTTIEQELHAMHGMSAEVGELHSLYQKAYQGHTMNEEHAKKEVGDILWMIAEYCTANGWNLDDIMWLNIDKLRLRYPEGFDAEHSLHRKEGDI